MGEEETGNPYHFPLQNSSVGRRVGRHVGPGTDREAGDSRGNGERAIEDRERGRWQEWETQNGEVTFSVSSSYVGGYEEGYWETKG